MTGAVCLGYGRGINSDCKEFDTDILTQITLRQWWIGRSMIIFLVTVIPRSETDLQIYRFRTAFGVAAVVLSAVKSLAG
jgi:hypothetical protein